MVCFGEFSIQHQVRGIWACLNLGDTLQKEILEGSLAKQTLNCAFATWFDWPQCVPTFRWPTFLAHTHTHYKVQELKWGRKQKDGDPNTKTSDSPRNGPRPLTPPPPNPQPGDAPPLFSPGPVPGTGRSPSVLQVFQAWGVGWVRLGGGWGGWG